MKLSTKASPQERGKALYEHALAEMYTEGPDIKGVLKALREAETLDSADAAYALATWYLFGENVDRNLKTAVVLLKKATTQEHVGALHALAICHEKGEGTRESPRLAFEAYLRAALRGEAQCVFEVARCLFWGIGTERDRRIARIWLKRASQLGIED